MSRTTLALGVLAALTVTATAAAQTKLTEEQILDRFKAEPSVQQVQEAAIRYYQVHPDRIRSLRAQRPAQGPGALDQRATSPTRCTPTSA